MQDQKRIGASLAFGIASFCMSIALSYAQPTYAAASSSAASSSAWSNTDGPPQGQPPAPPPEAVAACKGKADGDKVTFTGRGGEQLTGVCHLAGSVLAARPDGGPGGGSEHRPPPPR